MNILYILRHNPWGIGGGCYASRCYLDAFTSVFEKTHFDVCLCEEYLSHDININDYPNVDFVKVAERSSVEKMTSPLTGLLHRFDQSARNLLKTKQYDYCIFDHNSIAGPLVGLCKGLGIKTIVINHNCEAEYYRDNYDLLHRILFLRHVRKAEKKSFIGCDYNIFLTEEDKVLFEKLYGKSKTQSIVTGCFEFKKNTDANEKVNERSKKNEHLKLVISGTIGNVQNMDGIHFFLNELLPCVPKDAEIIIAGKNPPVSLQGEIESLNSKSEHARVTLIPNPTNIKEIVEDCDIFICPTRLGGGLKLRVMDGLRAGLPVVAHQVSARGYSMFAEKRMLWSFHDQEGFKDSLKHVIANIGNGAIQKKQIKEYAHQQFAFEEKVKMLKMVFNDK